MIIARFDISIPLKSRPGHDGGIGEVQFIIKQFLKQFCKVDIFVGILCGLRYV